MSLDEYMQSYRTRDSYKFSFNEPCFRETFRCNADDFHVLVTLLLSFGIRGFRTIDLHMRAVVNYNAKNPWPKREREWKGGPITSLDLSGYYTMSLPSSIGRLDNLKHLFLCSMPTLKSLPEEISHLTNLETLKCESKELLSLPEGIGCLSNLKDLEVSRACNLVSLPKSIGCLTNLEQLDLREMESLERLPDEIGNLANLVYLELYATGIETLPSSIGQLKKLKQLRLAENMKLQELPESVGDLTNLEELDLECSIISSLPSSIGRLKNLASIDLAFATNLYELPDTIGNIEHLGSIFLQSTKISSLPRSFWQLKCLRMLFLDDTNIPDLQNLGLMLVKRLPLLNWISIGSEPLDKVIEFFEKMNETKLRSIFVARSETSTRMNPNLWPHVLVNANAEADKKQNETIARKQDQEQWRPEDVPTQGIYQILMSGTEYIPNQADYIYQLLMDGRESFLDALRNKNC